MSYFDKNPNIFRLLFALLLLYLLGISAVTIVRFGSSPTDENLFTTPPSNLYTLDHLTAHAIDPDARALLVDGGIPAHNLLLAVNDRKTPTLEKLREVQASTTLSRVEITVHDLRADEAQTYEIDLASLRNLRCRELSPSAYVVDIATDGASDRAGMKVGDLIQRINGYPFANIFAADSILRSGQTGKDLAYVVLRGNEEISLHVTLASFGFPFPMLVAVISGLVFFSVGIFLGLKRPGIKAARLLGFLFLSQGFFLTNMFIRRDLALGGFALYVNLTVLIAVGLIFPLYVHSSWYFPQEVSERIKRRWVLVLGYVLALLHVAATIVFDYLGFFVGLGTLVLYTIVAFATATRQKTPEEKTMEKTFGWMVAAAWIGATVFFLYPLVTGWSAFRVMGYSGIPLLLIPVAYLYVIGRLRLLDLDLRVRRSAQYNMISAVWVVLLIAVFIWLMSAISKWNPDLPNIRLTSGSIEVLEEQMTAAQQTVSEKVLIIAGSILLFTAFWKLGRLGFEYIAKKFHRTRYDYRRAANELTEVMTTRLTMTSLSRGIVERLGELMQLKRVGVLFFRGQKACCCEEAYGFDGTTWRDFCIRTDRRLIEAIQRFQGEFRTDYLPEEFKGEFRKHEFQFLVPIRSKERLVGTILVGEKRSEATFQSEDLEFLRAVSRQASVAIENAFLYEELAGQERMKHELEIARNIQLESLPQTTPQIEGLDVAGTSIPAMEVGGDYYDFLNGSPDKITVVVGDVSGKGTSAALYMSKIQGMLRSLNVFGLSPREMFSRTNKLLWNDMEKKSFVTAFGALFEPAKRRVVLARAGHLPLLHYRAAARNVERIIPRGMGMGLSGNGAFDDELEEMQMSFSPGDIFLFVTDGITEGKNISGEEFGEERLIEVLRNYAHLNAGEIRDKVTSSVKIFSGEALQHDDQTVVVVKTKA